MNTKFGEMCRIVKQYHWDHIDRIEALYWALAHSHCGQNSWEYEALCRLARVFHPGLGSESRTVRTEAYMSLVKFLIESKT